MPPVTAVAASEPLLVPERVIPGDVFPFLHRLRVEIESPVPGAARAKAMLQWAKVRADGQGVEVMSSALGEPISVEAEDVWSDAASDLLESARTLAAPPASHPSPEDPPAVEPSPEDVAAMAEMLQQLVDGAVADFISTLDAAPGGKIAVAVAVADAAITRAIELIGRRRKIL